MAFRTIHFITGNKNKLNELRAGFVARNVTDIDLQTKAIDLPEIQGTVEAIARDKCTRAAREVEGPVLTEDTCLYFDAWHGLPGPYIKAFVESVGCDKFHELLAVSKDYGAEAVCTFAYVGGPGEEPVLFQGRTKGKIVPARGKTDFNWDCCFEYEGMTFSEMTKAQKDGVSHRGKAIDKLVAWLREQKS